MQKKESAKHKIADFLWGLSIHACGAWEKVAPKLHCIVAQQNFEIKYEKMDVINHTESSMLVN